MAYTTNKYGTIFYGETSLHPLNSRPDKKLDKFEISKPKECTCSYRLGEYCQLTCCRCPYKTTKDMPNCKYCKDLARKQRLNKIHKAYNRIYQEIIAHKNRQIKQMNIEINENLLLSKTKIKQIKSKIELKKEELEKLKNIHEQISKLSLDEFNKISPFHFVENENNKIEIITQPQHQLTKILIRPLMKYIKEDIDNAINEQKNPLQ